MAEITCEAEALDAIGRVIDFGAIKEKIGGWIDANWDHTTILWERDAELSALIEGATQQKNYLLPANPTAENMAAYLAQANVVAVGGSDNHRAPVPYEDPVSVPLGARLLSTTRKVECCSYNGVKVEMSAGILTCASN